MADERYNLGYTKGKEDAGKNIYDENQINARIISCHGSFSPEYEKVFMEYTENGAPIYVLKEKKIDIMNNDLTSGFLGNDLQIWNFCNADYLSKIVNMEKILGVDLTRHHNRYARTALYTYGLSKGGGSASKTSKKQFVESSSYEVMQQSELKEKKGIGAVASGFFSAMPKSREPLRP